MLKPRPLLNDEWIEKQHFEIHESAGIDFFSDPKWWVGFLDPDETEVFMECYENRTDQMSYDWQHWHEYEDVLSNTDESLRFRLKDEELYNTIPTEDQIEAVNQCIRDASSDIAYFYGESWHYFFVLNGMMPLGRNIDKFYDKTKEELMQIYKSRRGPYVPYNTRWRNNNFRRPY